MAVLPAPVFAPVVGETSSMRIVRIMKSYEGCSLSARRADLAALVGRGIDDELVVEWKTNCETFALGVLFAAGIDLVELCIPLRNGREAEVLDAIDKKFHAWRTAATSESPPAGALMHYRSSPYRTRADGSTIYDDHVEFMLEAPDLHGLSLHGGGGRENNEITIERGNIHFSAGKPLCRWLDPVALNLPDAAAPDTGDPVSGLSAQEAPTRRTSRPPPDGVGS
jgi:hypothetical protein